MTELSRDQIPEAWSDGAAGYDTAFAPYTGLYADEALERLGVGPGCELLDVAAGPGTVSLRAAALGASVAAVDFAPGMVELLTQRLRAAGHDDARAAVMDAQALDLDDATFDAAISMFGVMFVPDLDAGMREMRRVVRPGGRVAVGVWRLEAFRLVDMVGAALAAVMPGFELPATTPPWARVGDAPGLTAWLTGSGLVNVDAHCLSRTWRFDDAPRFFRELPSWSPPVQPLFDALAPALVDEAAEAFAAVIADATDEHTGGVPVDVLVGIGQVP